MQKNNERPTVRKATISEDEASQRLDNFLSRELKGVPTSRLYRIIRKGEVRVNSGRVSPFYKLKAGDIVRIPPVRTSEGTAQVLSERIRAKIEANILEETDDFIFINKPAELAVHGGSGVSFGLIEQLRKARPEAPCLELAHRLDRPTSGLLLIAKKRSALRRIQAAWQENEVEKTYLAVVVGDWQAPNRVDAPLSKHHVTSGERVARVDPEGKPATTLFTVKKRFGHATLMEIALPTGRMHQIRVHSAYIGHPIVGDDKYGDRTFNRAIKKSGVTRLMLHASRLRCPSEGWDKSAPLPGDFLSAICCLEGGGAS